MICVNLRLNSFDALRHALCAMRHALCCFLACVNLRLMSLNLLSEGSWCILPAAYCSYQLTGDGRPKTGWSQFEFAISNFKTFPTSVVCCLVTLCAMRLALSSLSSALVTQYGIPACLPNTASSVLVTAKANSRDTGGSVESLMLA